MGKSIKGHMTRVDRLYARLLYGQFVHSAWNKCIQVVDYLTSLLFYKEKLRYVYYYKIHCSLYEAIIVNDKSPQ